jgi:hypothetical protein
MKFIKGFSNYNNTPAPVNEEAGYGNDYFVDKKEEKTQAYFFKVGEGDAETGVIFKIGKFSRSSVISDTEKSYGVVHIEQIDPNDLDDYLVNDSDYRSKEEEKFELDQSQLNEAFNIYQRALDNYLEKNPKVTKFYDEVLENLEMNKADYLAFITPIIASWSKSWSIQDGPTEKTLIYTKISHE